MRAWAVRAGKRDLLLCCELAGAVLCLMMMVMMLASPVMLLSAQLQRLSIGCSSLRWFHGQTGALIRHIPTHTSRSSSRCECLL